MGLGVYVNAAKFEDTVAKLKGEGLRVRVRHLRQFKVRNESKPGMITIGEFKAWCSNPNNWLRADMVYEVDPRGGRTLCEIVTDEENPQQVASGMAICNPLDHYCRRIGRTKALGMALHELAHPEEDTGRAGGSCP